MVDTVKSNSITQLDALGASPPGSILYTSSGDGSAGYKRTISDLAAATTAGLGSTSSTYKIIRLATKSILKTLELVNSATLDTGGDSASLTLDVGAYYSDSTTDGTPAVDQGVQISANCFAAAVVSPLVGVRINVMTALASTKYNEPLWQALGLTTDPGGFVDVVIAVHAGADAAAAGSFYLEATFTD